MGSWSIRGPRDWTEESLPRPGSSRRNPKARRSSCLPCSRRFARSPRAIDPPTSNRCCPAMPEQAPIVTTRDSPKPPSGSPARQGHSVDGTCVKELRVQTLGQRVRVFQDHRGVDHRDDRLAGHGQEEDAPGDFDSEARQRWLASTRESTSSDLRRKATFPRNSRSAPLAFELSLLQGGPLRQPYFLASSGS
jgi:hypothetical protein